MINYKSKLFYHVSYFDGKYKHTLLEFVSCMLYQSCFDFCFFPTTTWKEHLDPAFFQLTCPQTVEFFGVAFWNCHPSPQELLTPVSSSVFLSPHQKQTYIARICKLYAVSYCEAYLLIFCFFHIYLFSFYCLIAAVSRAYISSSAKFIFCACVCVCTIFYLPSFFFLAFLVEASFAISIGLWGGCCVCYRPPLDGSGSSQPYSLFLSRPSLFSLARPRVV